MDPIDDGHNNTGTATSDRIQYDINVNIREASSYAQNPNLISYGRYEAEKNIERIINPILPPERSYVNTYGIPINLAAPHIAVLTNGIIILVVINSKLLNYQLILMDANVPMI